MTQTPTPAAPARGALFLSFGPDLERALERNVADALAEDAGRGDPTALLADPGARRKARVVCRDRAILCGRDWFDAAMAWPQAGIRVDWLAEEGSWMEPGQAVCEIEGPARAMLTAERSALNFIQTLSGTATRAALFAGLAAGSGAQVLDTRKTIPGLRLAQKYATRAGGGGNQRLALDDGILIKENHIASCGGVAQALERARALGAGVPIQIEVEGLEQLCEALARGAESVLLDNFPTDLLRQAVAINNARAKPALLEASGGIDESSIAAVAATGVDRISVGSITKRLDPVDFSMRVIAEG